MIFQDQVLNLTPETRMSPEHPFPPGVMRLIVVHTNLWSVAAASRPQQKFSSPAGNQIHAFGLHALICGDDHFHNCPYPEQQVAVPSAPE
jgi:hypothetical protein